MPPPEFFWKDERDPKTGDSRIFEYITELGP